MISLQPAPLTAFYCERAAADPIYPPQHAAATRASKGCNLPYTSYFNGRQLLLNELIGNCSAGDFDGQAAVEALLEQCLVSEALLEQCGAPVSKAGGGRLEPPLATALIFADRLDLRGPLARAGMTAVAGFLAATDAGSPEAPLRLLQLPLNLAMQASGERVVGQVSWDVGTRHYRPI
jgi:hypothetical protein